MGITADDVKQYPGFEDKVNDDLSEAEVSLTGEMVQKHLEHARENVIEPKRTMPIYIGGWKWTDILESEFEEENNENFEDYARSEWAALSVAIGVEAERSKYDAEKVMERNIPKVIRGVNVGESSFYNPIVVGDVYGIEIDELKEISQAGFEAGEETVRRGIL